MTEVKFRQFQEKYGIWGDSTGIRQIFESIEQVAATDISVLIIGESGTGKELVAKAIHDSSRRAKKPLVVVNSGAIPEGIIESELFGHEKGAFTGAVGERKGYFETANHGTVFLDEIGEMPLNAQVKILRVLEGNEFTSVGSTEVKKADVRIIAATNRDLEQEVKASNFRQDLYFRLRAVTIQIPPLRTRKGDIKILAERFAAQFSEKNGINFSGFDSPVFTIMENYPWPGNVRELKNLVESMIVLEKGALIDETIIRKYLNFNSFEERNLPIPLNKTSEQAEREFLYRALLDLKSEISQLREIILTRLFPPRRLKPFSPLDSIPVVGESDEIIFEDSQEDAGHVLSLAEMERDLIDRALRAHNGNKRKAAASLKISERTLYRKIKEYELPY